MAEIFRSVNGMPIQELIAHVDVVQDELQDYVDQAAAKAKADLAAHRHDGHAFIEVEVGDVDRHLILNDTRGLKAAMSIEYGRGPDKDGKGAMEGLFILHNAMNLPAKANRPRRRR